MRTLFLSRLTPVTLCMLACAAIVLTACTLLSPPSSTDFGKACGPDVECAGELACIEGFCQPGEEPEDDAGVADGG